MSNLSVELERDWFADPRRSHLATFLSPDSRWAYRLNSADGVMGALWKYCFDSERELISEEDAIRVTGLDEIVRLLMEVGLARIVDGEVSISGVARVVQRIRESRDANSRNGKKGAEARLKKLHEAASGQAVAKPGLSDGLTSSGEAKRTQAKLGEAKRTQAKLGEAKRTQAKLAPLTSDLSPLTSDLGRERGSAEGDDSASASPAASAAPTLPARKAKGRKPKAAGEPETPLPEGFAPSDKHRAYAEKHGIDLDLEFEKFCFRAERDGTTHARWNAALNTWLANARGFAAERGARPGGPSSGARAAGPEYMAPNWNAFDHILGGVKS